MNKKLPKQLSEKQENQRQQTANAVLHAIADLRALGEPLKIKALMEMTGLSRSVFAKAHIRAVLAEQGVIKPPEAKSDGDVPAKGAALSTEKRLREKLKIKEAAIAALTAENAELRRECELLRGRLFLLMQREN
jgi:DNA-binding transcriptional regulator YiaG